MRAVAFLIVFLLLVPVTSARRLGPEEWSASGPAVWGDDAVMKGGMGTVCEGEVRAGARGPMPIGPHKGEYMFWLETTSEQAGCVGMSREGWIHSPHADSTQTLREEGPVGTAVSFETTRAGDRLFFITEWDESNKDVTTVLTLASKIHEESILLLEY